MKRFHGSRSQKHPLNAQLSTAFTCSSGDNGRDKQVSWRHAARRSSDRRVTPRAAASVFFSFGGGGGDNGKVLHFVRHGVTEMNVHLSRARPRYGQRGFTDPRLYDTRLTPEGAAGAREAARAAARLAPPPELLVVSPLTRALQTAELVFGRRPGVPVEVSALFAERVYLSSDVGRAPAELSEEWGDFADFAHLDDVWWYSGGSSSSSSSVDLTGSGSGSGSDREATAAPLPPDSSGSLAPVVAEEPEDAFAARMRAARQWLDARPEKSIAVVSHWGVLAALTKYDFDNCEIRTLRASQLARP